MPCYHPLQAWRSPAGEFFFDKEFHPLYESLKLPCRHCIGCRIDYSREWAMRCLHEAKLWRQNCFVTLTFEDTKWYQFESLDYRIFQKFLKRLRRRFGADIRFFMCGEYGEEFSRPHYHACIFNHDFADKAYWKKAGREKLYRSRMLERLWPYGFSSVGSVSYDSAAYVARYVFKKMSGDVARDHYLNKDTGEIKEPEFCHMSLRPGIGAEFCKKFASDFYPLGSAVVNGRKVPTPAYYDSLFAEQSPLGFAELCAARAEFARARVEDSSVERLLVREKVAQARMLFKLRSLI